MQWLAMFPHNYKVTIYQVKRRGQVNQAVVQQIQEGDEKKLNRVDNTSEQQNTRIAQESH